MIGLVRSSRIRKNYDFREVYKKGKSFGSGSLILFINNNNLDYPRYGLSVGKKIGGAVKRNRVKRLLREIMRENIKEIEGGYDLVFVAKAGVENMGFNDLKQKVTELLRSASTTGNLKMSTNIG